MSAAASPSPAGRETILAAAAELFAAKGFAGVSVREVAERAGVSKANVFHHFSSKDTLYLAVLRSAVTRFETLLDDYAGERDGFETRLRGISREHLQNILANEGVSRLIIREVLESDVRRGQELTERVLGDGFNRLVEVIREGQSHSQLRADADPVLVASLVVAANVHFFQSRSVMRALSGVAYADDPESYSVQVMDILLNGIASR